MEVSLPTSSSNLPPPLAQHQDSLHQTGYANTDQLPAGKDMTPERSTWEKAADLFICVRSDTCCGTPLSIDGGNKHAYSTCCLTACIAWCCSCETSYYFDTAVATQASEVHTFPPPPYHDRDCKCCYATYVWECLLPSRHI